MTRLFTLLLLIACVSGPARAEPLTPDTFTEAVARALAAALPARTVTVRRDLELSIRDPAGTDVALSLANLYHDYRRDPAELGAIVEAFVSALSESAAARSSPARLDRTHIVPVIKDRQWLAENHRALRDRGVTQQFLHEGFNRELVVVYAEDTPTRTRYLMSDEDVGDRSELRALAVANLRRLLPSIEMRRFDDQFAMLSAGGDYEASLLLLDELWSEGQIEFEGDIVVAVPAKDVLLVTGSRNHEGLKVVRELVADFAAQERYRLSDRLFVYRNGQFRPFGRSPRRPRQSNPSP